MPGFEWIAVKTVGAATSGLLSERQLWRLIADGRIAASQINGRAAVRRGDLAQLLDEMATEPPSKRRPPLRSPERAA